MQSVDAVRAAIRFIAWLDERLFIGNRTTVLAVNFEHRGGFVPLTSARRLTETELSLM